MWRALRPDTGWQERLYIYIVGWIMGFLACWWFFVSPAHAQAVDQCAMSPMPGAEIILRLRCSIQILDAERMILADQLTDAKVRVAIAEAKQQRAEKELEQLKAAKPKVRPHLSYRAPSGG